MKILIKYSKFIKTIDKKHTRSSRDLIIRTWVGLQEIERNKQLKQNIGFLRQYLNERHSDDLITNEELERFLFADFNKE